MKKNSIYLFIAILFGLSGQIFLNYSEGFTRLEFTILSMACYFFAFSFLSFAIKRIPLSIAYAIWGGVGAAMSIFIGRFLFNEELTIIKFIALILIVSGITLIQLNNKKETNKKPPKMEA